MSLIVVLASAAVVSGVALFGWVVSSARVPAGTARANLVRAGGAVTDFRHLVLEQSAGDRLLRPGLEGMADRARRLTPSGVLDSLDRSIHLAGVSNDWPIERVLAIKVMLGAIGLAIGVLRILAEPSLTSLAIAAGVTVLGYMAPSLVLSRLADRRTLAIQRALPDVLDQITINVEAGLGFEAAVARVSRSGTSPLADELSRTLQDIQFGLPRETAFANLLERTDVADLRIFVHSLNQAERYGIPIAHVLRVTSSELREKRRERAEERAMKMPVIMLFPMAFCIMPAFLVVVAGPAFIRIMDSLGG
jgi:tight adherence protein C